MRSVILLLLCTLVYLAVALPAASEYPTVTLLDVDDVGDSNSNDADRIARGGWGGYGGWGGPGGWGGHGGWGGYGGWRRPGWGGGWGGRPWGYGWG